MYNTCIVTMDLCALVVQTMILTMKELRVLKDLTSVWLSGR